MDQVEIGHWDQLQWLWLVAITTVVVLVSVGWKHRAAAKFATANMIDRILPNQSWWQPVAAAWMSIGCLLLLVLCLLDVRWGKVTRDVPQKGIEVMFVLDVSRSMLAEDVTPSRLDRAKQQIKDTIDEMAGDRVGLVLFAGEVRQEIPLTSHYADFKQRLNEVGPENVSRGGSRLGDAITVGSEGFLSKTNQHKAMVLLTDGEDMESKPIEAARRANQEHGIRIFTIGLGDLAQGARIPVRSRQGATYLEHAGQQVWSKLDGEVLEKIAQESDGAYIPAGTKQVNMADVYHGYIAKLEQTQFETAKINQYEARFQWFLLPAVLLLLGDLVVSNWKQPATRTAGRSEFSGIES